MAGNIIAINLIIALYYIRYMKNFQNPWKNIRVSIKERFVRSMKV